MNRGMFKASDIWSSHWKIIKQVADRKVNAFQNVSQIKTIIDSTTVYVRLQPA